MCYDNIYLTNWVLVLAEERLEFEAFGRGQRSDLGVGRQGDRGRLGQQAVEQPQQGEGNQTAVRGSSSGRTGMIQQKKQKQTRNNQKGEKAFAVPADLPRGEDESAAQLVVPVDLGVVQCLVETGDQKLEWACTTGNKTEQKQSFNIFK